MHVLGVRRGRVAHRRKWGVRGVFGGGKAVQRRAWEGLVVVCTGRQCYRSRVRIVISSIPM